MGSRSLAAATFLAALRLNAALGQTPLGTGFTYQGQLRQNGQPYSGSANLLFKLFDASSGGNLLGTQTLNGVNVSAGLFTVLLNGNGEFGAGVFNGAGRWLEATVNGTPLTPRQALTAMPYAEFSAAPWRTSGNNLFYTAGKVGIGTTSPNGGLHVAAEPLTNGGTLSLEGVTHTYIAFFPDGAAVGREGYLGFPGPSINDIYVTNEITSGNIILAPGVAGTLLTAASTGRVGIGTTAPTAKLDVRGDVKLGSSGQFFAPGGDERLRIIRGTATTAGVITDGTGFTVQSLSTTQCQINFTTPFSGLPSTVVSLVSSNYSGDQNQMIQDAVANDHVTVHACCVANRIEVFSFIAIGPP